MKQITVTMVRVYLTEAEGKLDPLIKRLHDWEKVRGVTVFRGISGFGQSGKMHSSNLLSMSLDLPVVVEFFDEPDKVQSILEHLEEMINPGHIVSWDANLMVES
jgi:PII-like signaling protein